MIFGQSFKEVKFLPSKLVNRRVQDQESTVNGLSQIVKVCVGCEGGQRHV